MFRYGRGMSVSDRVLAWRITNFKDAQIYSIFLKLTNIKLQMNLNKTNRNEKRIEEFSQLDTQQYQEAIALFDYAAFNTTN